MSAPRFEHGIWRGISALLGSLFSSKLLNALLTAAISTGALGATEIAQTLSLIDALILLAMYMAITFWNWEYRFGYIIGAAIGVYAGAYSSTWDIVKYLVVPAILIGYRVYKRLSKGSYNYYYYGY